jgi:hypothetical protein
VCEGEVSVGGDGSEGMRENGKLDDWMVFHSNFVGEGAGRKGEMCIGDSAERERVDMRRCGVG